MRRKNPDPGSAGRRVLIALTALAILAAPWGAEALARGPAGEKIYAIRDPYLKRHNKGALDLLVTNLGVVGNPLGLDQFGAGWRNGEYLYAASMWIGAVASDNLAYVSTGAYEYELRPSLAEVDQIYESFEGATAGNRPGFSNRPDDDGDGLVDEDPLNGKDDDGDGRIDEDYAAIAQQMFACEYWDYTDEARSRYAEHRPLNVRVRQQSYAWASARLNEFIGFDFRIINDGFELLRRVYLGFFVDSDVGPRTADRYFVDDGGAYYTTDTTFTDPSIRYECVQNELTGETRNCAEQELHLDICYMYDVPDNGENATGGDVPGYFGGMFLGHTTDPFGERAPRRVEVHTARFFSGSNAYPAGDPRNDTERYDLLQSGAKPTRPTGQPDDYRYCFSAGPFSELAPGEELQLQVAFVIGAGKDGMLDNAIRAQQTYNGRWRNVDGDALGRTGIEGRETCLRALVQGEPLQWKDPCDSLNPTVRVIKETTCIPDNYVDDDCNCCTPLFRNSTEAAGAGLETLVRWAGTVAPPSPATNVSDSETVPTDPRFADPAGDRVVTIAWDNLSELSADGGQDPPRITFTGYRVYRVQNWNRPVGSAGPAPADWELIADLSLLPPDSLGEESDSYLLKYQQEVDSLELVDTGSSFPEEAQRWRYPIGRYVYRDSLGLKNGMLYFYDVTAYSAVLEAGASSRTILEGSPSAVEAERVVPMWTPQGPGSLDGIFVVPNPYIRGENPAGWDLTPSDADPTGTKLAFVGLPGEPCTVKIYTLSGDLVQTLSNESGRQTNGTVFWNLISRNGQDIVSGVYVYLVECGGKSEVGRFVVVR